MQQHSSEAAVQTYRTQCTRNKNTATDESVQFQEGHVCTIVYTFEPCLVNLLTYVEFTGMCQIVLRKGRRVSDFYTLEIVRLQNLPAKTITTAKEKKSGYCERKSILIGMISLILFCMTLPASLSM